jgi:hypothetical protein
MGCSAPKDRTWKGLASIFGPLPERCGKEPTVRTVIGPLCAECLQAIEDHRRRSTAFDELTGLRLQAGLDAM